MDVVKWTNPLAAVVGDDNGPTDIAPNEGHLTMSAPNMVAAGGAPGADLAVMGGTSRRTGPESRQGSC